MQNQNQQQATLSEQELMNDLLATEKQVMSAYSTYIGEASCPNLRQQLTSCFQDLQQIEYQIFDAMQKRGWYQIKDAADQDVQSAKQKFQQMAQQLQ